jgi:cardiolipin synthase (CMP-forming)
MMRVKMLATSRTYRPGARADERPGATMSYNRPVSDQHGPWTWPNVVTVVRLCCIPVFVWLLFGLDNRFAAALLLGGLGATDWVDGYLARRLDQTTELGKILDPTADRLLFLVGIVALLVDGSVPVWFGVASLVREGLVALTALVLGALGARRIDVTWLGKCATFALMFSFPSFLAAEAGLASDSVFRVMAWAFGIPGLVLSYYTVGQYVPLAHRALVEGRARRARADTDSAPSIR